MKNIVVIGGGTGTFVVLNALKTQPVHLTAIISMADDGGSTGILRDQYGVLPPGDVRRALVALSESSDTLRELFNYRFSDGGLYGHTLGNLFISALEKITGSFALALREASNILNINGEVVPVTYDDVRLVARLVNGKIIRGESNIDIPKTPHRAPIREVWLEPEAHLNPSVRRVLRNADLIVFGPGDLYTSVIPNLLIRGMPEEIKRSKATKVYICNLMTKAGETDHFTAENFVREVERYLGKNVLDYAVFNNKKPIDRVIKRYQRENAEFVAPPAAQRKGKPKFILRNLITVDKLVRHDFQKRLPKVLLSLLEDR